MCLWVVWSEFCNEREIPADPQPTTAGYVCAIGSQIGYRVIGPMCERVWMLLSPD